MLALPHSLLVSMSLRIDPDHPGVPALGCFPGHRTWLQALLPPDVRSERDRAWHAGRSVWKGRNSCNDYTIGIELVNLNDGNDPYPDEQHQANVVLVSYLADKYNVSVDDIMGHLDIALPPGRKSDPRKYDLNRLRNDVAAVLGRR